MKYNMRVTFLLVGLFLLSQLVGLSFIYHDLKVVQTPTGEMEAVHPETAIGPRPEVEEGDSVLFVLTGVFIGTVLLLLIIRFAKVNYWKMLFFISVLSTMTVSLGVFLNALLAFAIALALTIIKIFRPHLLTHNLTELLIYSGIAVLFVPLFNVFWMVVLLLIISGYDAFAVWQSKHMIKLANFQTGNGLFAGLLINAGPKPQRAVKTNSSSSAPRKGKREIREAILGGGDIAFPLIFSGVVMDSLATTAGKDIAFLKVLIIPLILAFVLFLLLTKGKEGHFYPAMPFLTAGCLAGFAIINLI